MSRVLKTMDAQTQKLAEQQHQYKYRRVGEAEWQQQASFVQWRARQRETHFVHQFKHFLTICFESEQET